MSSDETHSQTENPEKQRHAELMEKLEEITIGLEQIFKLQQKAVSNQEQIGRLVKILVWVILGLVLLSILVNVSR